MEDKLIQLTGTEAGPTSMILVGVHGNERCGIEALETLLPTLTIQKGVVYIGFGNPEAIENNVRYTEANLNRMFKSDELLSVAEKKSYEYFRAQFLKEYLDKSECLLDIHATVSPDGKRFIICEKNGASLAQYLPFNLVVNGFDQVEPGGTDFYMNQSGKIGICVECGYIEDANSTLVAEQSIISFLQARGHIKGETKISTQEKIQLDYAYLTKTNSFSLAKQFSDFEDVSRGQLIGNDGTEEVRAATDGVILFARNRSSKAEEAFLIGHDIKEV